MKKFVGLFTVVQNQPLNTTNHRIVLQSPNPLPPIVAGQFANIEVPGNKEVFLRRPFSIYEVDYSCNQLSLLVKILGKGSRTLTEISEGSTLSLIYPLGNGFTLPQPGETVLGIGGGSGVAPILQLAKNTANLANVKVLLGARTAADHIAVDAYRSFAELAFATDDGSLGEKGMVTDHSFMKNLSHFHRIYACGPLPMMKAIARMAQEAGVACEVSLENLMACGFGVCLCCIEPSVRGNLTVCTDGPVFNINDLTW